MQFQADLLGVPVRRALVQETTAMGAAYLAGLGRGVWASTKELTEHWREDRAFVPEDTRDADHRYRHWRRAVERALGWAQPNMDDSA
jgi:glycerol kinase